MNYETEPWYKLYIRESTEDKLLPVLNRSLRDFLLRLAKSRNNPTILARTENPGADIARALGAHPDEVPMIEAFVGSMLADGYLRHRKGRLWITNFVEAQEARSAGARRQKAYRDNRKKSRDCDATEYNGDDWALRDSDITRDAHVTLQERRSEKRRDEERRDETTRGRDSEARPGWLSRSKELPRKPDEEPQPRADELAERISFSAWGPSQQMLDWAKEKRLPDAKFDAALIELRDKCQGLHDVAWWDLKAIAFIRNAIAWHSNPKAGNGHAGPAESTTDDAALMRRARLGEYGKRIQDVAETSGNGTTADDIREMVRARAEKLRAKPAEREGPATAGSAVSDLIRKAAP